MTRNNATYYPTRFPAEKITASEILDGQDSSFGKKKLKPGIIGGELDFHDLIVSDDFDLTTYKNKKKLMLAACDFSKTTFKGLVNFSNTNLHSGFWVFKKSVNFEGASFEKLVDFSGSDIRGVNFKDTKFKHNITLDYQTKLDGHVVNSLSEHTDGLLIFKLQNGMRIGIKKNRSHSDDANQLFLINEAGVEKQLTKDSITALYSAFQQEYDHRKKSKWFFSRDNISKKLAGVHDPFTCIVTILTHAQGDATRRTALALNAVLHPSSTFIKHQCHYVQPPKPEVKNPSMTTVPSSVKRAPLKVKFALVSRSTTPVACTDQLTRKSRYASDLVSVEPAVLPAVPASAPVLSSSEAPVNPETRSQQSAVAYYLQPLSYLAGVGYSLWQTTTSYFASETSVDFARRFFIHELKEQILVPKTREMTPDDETFNNVLRMFIQEITKKIEPKLSENPNNNTISGFFINFTQLVETYQKAFDFDASDKKKELMQSILMTVRAKQLIWEKQFGVTTEAAPSSTAVFSPKPM